MMSNGLPWRMEGNTRICVSSVETLTDVIHPIILTLTLALGNPDPFPLKG